MISDYKIEFYWGGSWIHVGIGVFTFAEAKSELCRLRLKNPNTNYRLLHREYGEWKEFFV